MKMITQDEITVLPLNEKETYANSWIYQWLNEDFKDTLYNYKNIIVQNADWNATRDEVSTGDNVVKPETLKNQTIVQGDVGTLNAYEYYQSYKNASTSTGYLNIGYYWWLITSYNDLNIRSVNFDGNLSIYSYNDSGVRPSVNLKSDIELDGEGTKSNPYTIMGDKAIGTKGDFINTRLSGEYVKVDGKVYRIVGIEDDNTTKLTSVDYVRNDNKAILKKKFGTSVEYETFGDNNYWGYYLKNTWLTTELQKYITEGIYYLLAVEDEGSYKNSICIERNTSKTTKDCEKTGYTWEGLVGLPRVGEMFSAQLADSQNDSKTSGIWLITPYNEEYSRYVIGSGDMDITRPSDTYAVRPSINLKSTIKIISGDGKSESTAYEVGL